MSSPSDRTSAAASHSPGEVLALISSGAVVTRADIARITGMARSTVSQRVDALIAHGLVDENADGGSTGGRPPRRLALRTREHAVAGVDLGASHCRVALMDIGGATLAVQEEPLSIGDGPDSVLRHVERTVRTLLDEAHRKPETLRSIGVGVPGPVEFSTGRPVDPPIMPGWHQYPIPEFFAARFGARALVDNDVNVMALAEQRRAFPDCRYLLYIKVGTGIGCGIVADGQLHRGAQGCSRRHRTYPGRGPRRSVSVRQFGLPGGCGGRCVTGGETGRPGTGRGIGQRCGATGAVREPGRRKDGARGREGGRRGTHAAW